MSRLNKVGIAVVLALMLTGSKAFAAEKWHITVTNYLDIARPAETITLSWKEIVERLPAVTPANVTVEDEGGKTIVAQLLDYKNSGTPEELIFQADLPAGKALTFKVSAAGASVGKPKNRTFGRYVPERLDDFAWENDKIAHRIYGQAIMKDPKEHLVSSGIDVWVKKVPYPIIDKWYKGGKYHEDHGEGVDCYSVKTGRGCGGVALWKNSKMYVSENWVTHKVLANGPLRTCFELTYKPWDAAGQKVSEVKRISIDLGSQMSRVESTFTSDDGKEIPFVVGLLDHKTKGAVAACDKNAGWSSMWDLGDKKVNGYVATGIVMDPAKVQGMIDAAEHHLVLTTAKSGQAAVYYIGAGWSKGGFADAKAWQAYLEQFARRLASPVTISNSL